MSPFRRWPFLIILAVISLLIFLQLPDRDGSSLLNSQTPSSVYKPPSKPANVHFTWADRKVQYPVASLTALPTGRPKKLPRVQFSFGVESENKRVERLQRRNAVKDSFMRCFHSYRERAWMQDELSPISGGSRNVFGGWAATLVDSLDTMHIMGMSAELEDAISAVTQIDFTTSTESVVNVFETTIRYLGGFLAAYDLTADQRLLDKAVEVGEMLLVAFDTPNHMPVSRWEWQKAASDEIQVASTSTLVSELGSFTMEFTRLSQVTQDMRWFDAVQRITDLFDQQQAITSLPGMWPVVVNAKDMNLTQDTEFTLGGMADSLYEYFPKTFALLGGKSPVYRKLYEHSMATAIRYNFFRPMTPDNDDILMSGNAVANSHSDISLDPQGQHLGCFIGGMLALGGRLFNLPEHVTMGRKLVDGCIWAYDALPQGIMPETFHLVPCPSRTSCVWNPKAWKQAVLEKQRMASNVDAEPIIVEKRLPHGFADIGDRRYILRPESIESIFILYRITGTSELQDYAWKMFQNIQNLTETAYGNAELDDITVSTGMPPKSDRMESFWMAETLKYFYLIFSEPELISLDDYVLNTEAHPFRRPK